MLLNVSLFSFSFNSNVSYVYLIVEGSMQYFLLPPVALAAILHALISLHVGPGICKFCKLQKSIPFDISTFVNKLKLKFADKLHGTIDFDNHVVVNKNVRIIDRNNNTE